MTFRQLHIALAFVVVLLTLPGCESDKPAAPQDSSTLLLRAKGASYIASNLDDALISNAYQRLQKEFEAAVDQPIEVPLPKDPGGGYTHEKHKSNYQLALTAATLYKIDGDAKALARARDILLGYASMYGDLPLHPERKELAPGKLFWQVLNEQVALVYFIQAYDAIRSGLTAEEDQKIADDLIRPMVQFIKEESARTFNSLHNHGMWAVAGVGMAGYVLDEPLWVTQSLFGSDTTGERGYFAQIAHLFSPDGYYSEGPYYHRYALMPLVLLAQAVDANEPARKVFEFKDGVILKAVTTLVELSDCKGKFLPLNDAIKSKSIESPELGYALPLLYAYGDGKQEAISLIDANGNLALTDAVIGLKTGQANEYQRSSQLLKDGPEGKSGALAILRASNGCDGVMATMKFGTHGMGHGHFDQLSMLLYDADKEVLSDYGAARYLNVPQKNGGRYLPENNTWAKQTIAHNTPVIGEQSQHSGQWKHADTLHPELIYFQEEEQVKAVSAMDATAYPGATLHRVIALVEGTALESFVVDVTHVSTDQKQAIDLPFYYTGETISASGDWNHFTQSLKPLGKEQGYQHLWHTASSDDSTKSAFTFLHEDRFYSITSASTAPYEMVKVVLGANDPHHNLRQQRGLIYRSEAASQVWVNIIEPHGNYDTVFERTKQAASGIASLNIKQMEGGTLWLQITLKTGDSIDLSIDIDTTPRAGSTETFVQLQFKSKQT